MHDLAQLVNGLPGFPYQGAEPDGFQTRDEWVTDLERYAAAFAVPIGQGVGVTEVAPLQDGRFSVQTSAGALVATNVVVATGPYQVPRVPAVAAEMAGDVHQVHSGGYRNPGALPPGAVLVVGTGNSGSQIAEELSRAGRTVYLSVGYSGFPLRRYRGRDMYWRYVNAKLDQFRFEGGSVRGLGNTTGCGGGRALNLHRFARDGVRLVGRIQSIDGAVVTLPPDLAANLAAIDRRTDEFRQRSTPTSMPLVSTRRPTSRTPDAALSEGRGESPAAIDLRARGIASVVWGPATVGTSVAAAARARRRGCPARSRGWGPSPVFFFAGMRIAEPASARIGRVGPKPSGSRRRSQHGRWWRLTTEHPVGCAIGHRCDPPAEVAARREWMYM